MLLEESCPCGGKNLDKMLQPGILLSLWEGRKYGSEIIRDLAENPMFHGQEPDKTGVYRYLKRMEQMGFLRSDWELREDGGNPRRIYEMREAGRQCLGNWQGTLREYLSSLRLLLDRIAEKGGGVDEPNRQEGSTLPEGKGLDEQADSVLPEADGAGGEAIAAAAAYEAANGTDEPEDGSMGHAPGRAEQGGQAALYLITGFLGAGKSSFLSAFMRSFPGKKIQLIINEFGNVGIDGELLRNLGAEIREISGGSVFCACRIDQFEGALRNFVRADTDVVLVEASGLSDPTGVYKLLHDTGRFPRISYQGSVCLVDALRFPKVYKKSASAVKQLASCDLVLLNKIDLAGEGQLAETRRLIHSQRPDVTILESSYGKTDVSILPLLKERHTEGRAQDLPLTADLSSKKMEVQARAGVSRHVLEKFLRMFLDQTFRVKGFVQTEEGLCLVDCAGTLASIRPYPDPVPPERIGHLVILSGIGMHLAKHLREAAAWYPDDFWIVPKESKNRP